MALDMRFSEADEQFREEIRAFLAAELTPELRAGAADTTAMFVDRDLATSWQRILHARGWGAVSWPREFGGPGWTPSQLYIFREECARAGAPTTLNQGVSLLGPVLHTYGSDAQKSYYLPKILSGEHYWCRGYSEPGSGSDLASLQTRAVADGDDYIVNGTKIWTTHAQFADHIFCLVRTRTDGAPQKGISFLLIDMATPGIRVEPIITLAGDHEVNQVFLDDVRVPRENRVGPENEGWSVAKHLLQYERGGNPSSPGLLDRLAGLESLASRVVDDRGPLLDDPDFAGRLRALEIELKALEFTELTTLARVMSGDTPGAGASSLMKLGGADVQQAIDTLRMEAVHYYGLPRHADISLNGHGGDPIGPSLDDHAMASYLTSRAASIYGGSHQVQRNIIAKQVLGL